MCCSGSLYCVPFGPHIRYLYICFLQTLLRMIVQAKSVISATDNGYSRPLTCAMCVGVPPLYNPRQRLPRRPLTVFEASAKCPADVQLMRVGQLFDLLLSLSIYLTGTAVLSTGRRSPPHYYQTRRTRNFATVQESLPLMFGESRLCMCVTVCVPCCTVLLY